MVRHGVDNNIQTASTKTPRAVTSEAPEANSDVADKLADRDYKRRRASYRGKVGTKTGPAAFREMIQKHMIGHSVELDRELVLGGGFLEERKVDTKKEQPRLELMNWRNFTDALESSTFGNNNNFLSERSSTRLCKPPGGSSTVGSLIFGGGGDGNQPSYLDERKSRRFNPHREEPQHGSSNNDIKMPDSGAAEMSYYAKPTAAQEQRDRLAIAPGAVSRETLSQQPMALAVVRRGNRSGSSSDYFANGMGGQDGGDNQIRRTRRMFAAPGGASSFKLG
ncbi:unnamed protein product [Phytophthora lilii]|uniref:Unnamed protein product n=1 Tax=Phytophthora lilii TaxID=2077276 RepID=A0A9W7CQV3_9STRA|nr:unnamed protein product [Phytophthora lilii]